MTRSGCRTWATLLLSSVPPCAAAALGACGDDTVLLLPEAGSLDATTVDSGADASTEAEAEAAVLCSIDAGAVDDAELVLGVELIGQHKCEKCHGDTLSGNPGGVPSNAAEGGTAYPPNLTPDPATGLGCWTQDQIVRAILEGIDNQGMPLCPPMPRYGHLGDAGLDLVQAEAIAEYLQSLPPVSMTVPATPNCPVPEAGSPDAADSGVEVGADASDAAVTDALEAAAD